MKIIALSALSLVLGTTCFADDAAPLNSTTLSQADCIELAQRLQEVKFNQDRNTAIGIHRSGSLETDLFDVSCTTGKDVDGFSDGHGTVVLNSGCFFSVALKRGLTELRAQVFVRGDTGVKVISRGILEFFGVVQPFDPSMIPASSFDAMGSTRGNGYRGDRVWGKMRSGKDGQPGSCTFEVEETPRTDF